MVSLDQLQSSITNFIRVIKGRRREQRAFALAAACFSAGYFVGGNKWIPEWKEWRSLVTVQLGLYAVGAIAFAYAFVRLWRATHAPDLPPPKDRPLVIKGPSAFTPGDGELFRRLGRESELQELMGYVLDNQTRLVVLMGESGAGKTSLLRAGLPHILKDKGVRVHYWEAVPTDSAERLLRAIQEDWHAPGTNGAAKPATLDELINPAEKLGAEQHVIVLDQFEQLRGRNAVLQFLRRVAREARPPHRLTWIVAFRREYGPEWFEFMIAEHKRGFYPKEMSLRLFTAEAATDVTWQLMQEANISAETAVFSNLIEAATNADNQVSPVDIGIGLLVLSELHERLGGRTLTVKDYQFAGGAEGLLTQYINRCLERFAETEREPLLKALLALRNPETNQRLAEGLPLDQLAAEAATDPRRLQPQLERLVQRDIRLLETVAKDSVTHYRLPHERLIPALHRLTGKLLGEIEQARLRFENAFLAWQKNDKREHYLLKGKDLRWIERNASQMPWGSAQQEKLNYLRQSLRRRNFVRMGAVAAAVALMVVGWVGNLYYQRIEGRRYLSERNYPPELYDYQHQLKKLKMIEPLDLKRFTWLTSDSIEELSVIATSSSDSITGLSTLSECDSLKELKIDLSHSHVGSLVPLAKLNPEIKVSLDLTESVVSSLDILSGLNNLTKLKLDLAESKLTNLEALGLLTNLKQLTVDLSYVHVIDKIDFLAKLKNLQSLKLNLSGSGVSNIEPLEKLKDNLTQLELDLSNGLFGDAKVRYLEPLAQLENLKQLTLNLSEIRIDGVKERNLKFLAQLSNLEQLTLDLRIGKIFSEKPNESQIIDLEPLAKLKKLKQLTLHLDDKLVNDLRLPAQLSSLTKLTLDLSDSDASDLEPLTKLSNQIQLILNIEDSRAMSKLAKLNTWTQVTLDLRHATDVTTLESLVNLAKVEQLTLDNLYSVNRLEPITKLLNLNELTLDFNNHEAIDLEPLVSLNKLRQLTLNLNVGKVSNLEQLVKLSSRVELIPNLTAMAGTNLEPLAKLNKGTPLTLFFGEIQESDLKSLTNLTCLRRLAIGKATSAQRMSLQKLPASVAELSF